MLDAHQVSLDIVAALRQPARELQRRDADLHRQLRRSASSVPLNIAEGERRSGKDRLHHFRVAAGSAAEVQSALRTAVAWGDLTSEEVATALELLDRLLAMLWRLTH